VTTYVMNALGLALLHSLWQVSALAFLVWVGLGVLQKSQERYLVSCVAFALVPISFLITVLWVYTPDVTDSFTVKVNHVVADVVSALRTSSTSSNTVFAFHLESYLPYLVMAWLLGVAGYALHLFGGWVYVLHLRRSAKQLSNRLSVRLESLSQGLGLKQVTFLKTTRARVPMVVGFLKPVVLIPVSMLSGLTMKQLEAILLHELAHIKRYDYLVNGFQTAVETIFFYHPLVWWLSKKIRSERENCCDDVAVARSGDALLYANALATLETLRLTNAQLVLAANGGQLIKRIQRLVMPEKAHHAPVRLLALLLVLTTVLAACTNWLGNTSASLESGSKESICLLTTVSVGKYEMPAFNTASFRVMAKQLTATNFKPRCDVDAPLELHYTMTFDSRKTTWQAKLTASDRHGTTVWSSAKQAAIQQVGAFQYTTESTAELLLSEFLAVHSN
jgi:beta-lactamase regulating signal transducer with metallopeptidase domain